MRKKVLCIIKLYPAVAEKLEKDCDVIYISEENRENILAKLIDVAALISIPSLKIDEDLLRAAPHLKVVSNVAVGYNNFDLEALNQRKVWACHTPGVLNDTTADLVMALILSTARRIPELDYLVRSGRWPSVEEKDLFGLDVHHKKVGIIGMGRIGGAVAKRCHLGFNMEVSYFNRKPLAEQDNPYGYTYKSLDQICQESDFIVLMPPLTEETRHLIGQRELSMMKKTAILINASRGPVIDTEALVKALENKQIAGAGIDVYDKEPIGAEHPLLAFPNVVALPHIGSATDQTREAMAKLAIDNVLAVLNGRKPLTPVPESFFF